jgi:hypothetical protein
MRSPEAVPEKAYLLRENGLADVAGPRHRYHVPSQYGLKVRPHDLLICLVSNYHSSR